MGYYGSIGNEDKEMFFLSREKGGLMMPSGFQHYQSAGGNQLWSRKIIAKGKTYWVRGAFFKPSVQ